MQTAIFISIGTSPRRLKASDFDSDIRRFESSRPCQLELVLISKTIPGSNPGWPFGVRGETVNTNSQAINKIGRPNRLGKHFMLNYCII